MALDPVVMLLYTRTLSSVDLRIFRSARLHKREFGTQLPINPVAADVRKLIPFRLREIGASSRRLLRFRGSTRRRFVSGSSLPTLVALFRPQPRGAGPSLDTTGHISS